MMVSGEVQHSVRPFARQTQERRANDQSNDSLKAAVPTRYRDGLGGLDIAQVKRDQRLARRRVVRAMMVRVKRLMVGH